jgi:hypothetical protein
MAPQQGRLPSILQLDSLTLKLSGFRNDGSPFTLELKNGTCELVTRYSPPDLFTTPSDIVSFISIVLTHFCRRL